MKAASGTTAEQRRASWRRPHGNAIHRPRTTTTPPLDVAELVTRLSRGRLEPAHFERMIASGLASEIVIRIDAATMLVSGWSMKLGDAKGTSSSASATPSRPVRP